MTKFILEDAVREGIYLKLFMYGMSGSGKTTTALYLARQLIERDGGKIFFVNTETGRAKKKAGLPGIPGKEVFQIVEFGPYSKYGHTYKPENFRDAIKQAAEDDSYTVIVIDSVSHEWAGQPDGVLDIVDKITGGNRANTQKAWGAATPRHDDFVQTMISAPIHVILCARGKIDHKGDDKTVLPIQRSSMKYESDIVFHMKNDAGGAVMATVVKADDPNLMGRSFRNPDEDLGAVVIEFLGNPPESLTYGDGTVIPADPRVLALIAQYRAEHEGAMPASRQAAIDWHNDSKGKAQGSVSDIGEMD